MQTAFLMRIQRVLALLKPLMTFQFRQRVYRYFSHPFNGAWASERTVEIPIVWGYVQAYRGRKILEVGNVLSHYFSVTHDIVDKYEMAPGVLNEDIASWRSSAPYDLIVSISTIEHVGYDEFPKDPAKVVKALHNLKSLLAEGGMLVVTFPLNYNPEFDKFWMENTDLFSEKRCLRRVSRFNFWKETPLCDVINPQYNSPYPYGNWVAVGWITR